MLITKHMAYSFCKNKTVKRNRLAVILEFDYPSVCHFDPEFAMSSNEMDHCCFQGIVSRITVCNKSEEQIMNDHRASGNGAKSIVQPL